MHTLHGAGRYSDASLHSSLETVLTKLKNETDLFEALLCSMPERMAAIRQADGGHTDYRKTVYHPKLNAL